EDGERRDEQVRLHQTRLPGMPDPRVRVGIGDEVLERSVEEARQADRGERCMVPPGFPALHGFVPAGRTLWSASTRRAASVVARAVSVAPVTARMPRFNESSSSRGLPWNCSYQCAFGRYSSGSEKERTSMRAIAPEGSTTTMIVSGIVRTVCVS